MTEQQLPILITGAGAPGTRGTIYALQHNPAGDHFHIVGVDAKNNCVGRYLVDSFHTVPPPEHPSYLDELIAICKRESVSVVIPQTTREVALLSQHKERMSQQGICTMVSDAQAIKTANNKWLLVQEFERLGLPVPSYTLARSESELLNAATSLGYPDVPVVVKPAVSNGMRGVRVLKEQAWNVERFLSEKPSDLEISLSELVNILRRGEWPDLLVSEYLPGHEYSVDLFVGSKVQVAIPRIRQAIRSGITFESSLDYRDDLAGYSIQAAKHLGLQYAVGFQFKLDREGVPKILECNPRVQGTMVASVFSGVNVIWLSLRELSGDAPDELPRRLRPGCFYRFWGGISVCGEHVDEI